MKKTIQACAVLLMFLTIGTSAFAQLPGAGNAYDFNSNYISAPNNPTLNPNFISIEAWIKADSWGANSWENVIVSKDGWASGNQGYVLRAGANGTLSFNFAGVGAWYEVTSTPVMALNKWYHVAGTYDGTTLRIYINGEEVNTFAYNGTINNGTYDLHIGRAAFTNGGNRYFDGMIDEVRVWSQAIPQSSIQDYMCQKVTATHPEYASLSAYYNFDDAGSVIDISPNTNDGTVTGAIQSTSAAAIGDVSMHTYTGAVDMTLAYGSIDSLQIESSSALQAIHLYRVDMAPNTSAAPTSIEAVDDTHYYGVFAAATGAYTYDASYYYDGNPMASGSEQYLNLAGRDDATAVFWFSQGALVNLPTSEVEKSFTSSKEIMLAIVCSNINLNVSGAQSLCTGESLNLVDQTVNSNYQWYNTAGMIVGQTNSNIDITLADDYYLIANDGLCADTSSTITVTLSTFPTAVFGSIAAVHCENDADIVLSGSTPAGGIYSGNGIVGGTDFSPATAGTGTFTLYYEYTNAGGCSHTDSTEVTVNETPATPTMALYPGLDDYVEACVIGCGEGSSIESFLDGTSLGTSADTCFQVDNGSYEAICIVNGCASDTASIIVEGVGIEEIQWGNAVKVSPNPTNDFVVVSVPTEGTSIVSILDASGRVLFNQEFKGSEMNLDLSTFDSGMYVISIASSGYTVTKKILKN